MIRRVLVLALAGFALSSSAQAARHYVDIDASGANDGSSWTDAYVDLQSALGVASSGDEIWVAEGTYWPTSGTDRGASFNLPSGVELFGGFAGGESQLEQRDWTVHKSVLSGDIGVLGVNADNSYHVLRMDGTAEGTLLDGVVVRDGYANEWPTSSPFGGGVRNEAGVLRIRNCTIRNNESSPKGAGIANLSGAQLLVEGSEIVNNFAGGGGGGLYNAGSVAKILNSRMSNSSIGGAGGSIRNEASATCEIESSTVSGAASGYNGGAIACFDSDLIVRSSDVGGWANDVGGAIYHQGGNLMLIENSRFQFCITHWGGGAIYAYSDVIRMTDVVFRDCTAGDHYGGGAVTIGGGQLELDRVQFLHNIVGSYSEGGGAIMHWSGALRITNSVFLGNWSYTAGAIRHEAGELTIVQCSFFDNEAGAQAQPFPESGKGGALLNLSDAPALIANSIFWGDSATFGGNEIHTLYPEQTTISHCLIAGSGGSGAGWDATLGIDGGGNWDLDPLYTNPTGGDLTLQPTSVLINAGDVTLLPAGITLDLAKNARVVGPSVDVGAYEWQGSVPTRTLSISELRALFGGNR